MKLLVGVPIEIFLGFMVLLLVVIIATYWGMAVVESRRRRQFLDDFADDDLMLNKYNRKVVYRVNDTSGALVTAVVVWRGKAPERNGDTFKAEATHFSPFDRAEFSKNMRW